MKFSRAIACSALLFPLLLAPPKINSAQEKMVKIGLAAPLTGEQAAIGLDIMYAAQMAVDEANETQLIPGVKLVLDAVDDKADPKEAVSVAHRFAADSQVVAVVGHLNSGCSIPASAVYHDAGLLMLTPSSTNPKLTEQGFDNIFRICSTDTEQGARSGWFATKILEKRTFAIIHDKTEYGQGLAEEFKKAIASEKTRVVAFEGITPGDQDFTALLTRIKSRQPELIYFGGMYPEGALIAKQINQVGMQGVTLMGGDGLYAPEFITLAKKDAEGAIVSFLAPPFDKVKNAKQWVKKFRKKYKQIKTYAPYAYDSTNLVIQAIKNSAACDDRAKVLAALRQLPEYDGVVGKTSFDERGNAKNREIYFYVVRKGFFNWYKVKDTASQYHVTKRTPKI